MRFNPKKHHRRSIRLKEYDYSQAGAYFVTMCTKGRECLFGEIGDGAMRLNDAGQMVDKWWVELTNKFPCVGKDEYVVMPNHLHGIVMIVGADLRVRSTKGAHTGAPLPKIVQWFKTMVTNGYIRGVKQYDWAPFPGKLWQRGYHEHIIRDEKSLNNIRRYIQTNPLMWAHDAENPNRIALTPESGLASSTPEHYGP